MPYAHYVDALYGSTNKEKDDMEIESETSGVRRRPQMGVRHAPSSEFRRSARGDAGRGTAFTMISVVALF